MPAKRKRTDAGDEALAPRELRCEYRISPKGIDNLHPRLSWTLRANRRDARQKAYRILVASCPLMLRRNTGDLWDSGRVRSAETAHIAYAGARLQPYAACWWKVMVWDASGKASQWSRPASWSMGILREQQWCDALWIGYDAPYRRTKKTKDGLLLPPARYLRRDFRLSKEVSRAVLYSTALGIHDVSINGQRICAGFFSPGWTDYDKRVYYRTHDVTGLLREGQNAIGAVLADGWYAGYVGYKPEREHYGHKTRLRCLLRIEYADGTHDTVVSDRRWRASTGPTQEADFLMGETYDARAESPGWDAPGFDAKGWSRASVGASCSPCIQSAPHQPVKIFKEITPVSITQPRKGRYVLDMGTNFAGVVRLKLRNTRRGQRITLRYAERLNPDGTVYTANLRAARATDTYTCAGGKKETWMPRFTFHGFQYVEIRGLKERPKKDTVTGIELTSAAPVAGRFSCSDAMLNKLYRNICQTQRANFIDIPTDCPQRDERLGWTGDAQIYIRTATYNSDVEVFFHKWMTDLADAQREDGQFPMVAPLRVAGSGGGPAWAEAGVICPWTLHEVYGDKQILEQHYRGMVRFLDFCRKRSKGCLPPAKFHCFGDWLNIQAETPKEVIYTAYFAQSARLVSDIAAVLGKKRDAERFAKLYERIRTAFNKAYVDDQGHVLGKTQCGYVLALAFDLLQGKRKRLAAKHLVADIRERNWHLSTGFVGTKDLMLVLSKIGRHDVAYRLLHNTTFPSWGFSIVHGATSIWERWNGWTPDAGFGDPGMNSFAHYAFGAVGQWMFGTIGGIDTDGPGFKRITIRPVPGGKLNGARASYKSIRGEISSAWAWEDDDLELRVSIPANTTATIHIPARKTTAVKENGLPLSRAPGVRSVRQKGNTAIVRVGSGEYDFVSKGAARLS